MENRNFEYTGWKVNGFVALLAMRGLKERELKAYPKGYLLVKVSKKLHFKL